MEPAMYGSGMNRSTEETAEHENPKRSRRLTEEDSTDRLPGEIFYEDMAQQSNKTEFHEDIRLFIGNPGVGKSTLLNCIINEKHNMKKGLFKSGISIGSGMTSQLQEKRLGDIIYLDTPGLEDRRLRKEAAIAITNGLKKNGNYKIFFVITLESGRIRASDVATIRIVMECATDIKHYGIIINKLSRKAFERFKEKENQEEIIAQLKVMDKDTKRISLPMPLFLPLISKLEDEEDALADVPDLMQFAEELGENQVKPENVKEIPYDRTFERYCEALEVQLLNLRQSNIYYKRMIEENNQHYKNEQDRLLKEIQERFSRELHEEKSRFELQNRDLKSFPDYELIENDVSNTKSFCQVEMSTSVGEHQKLQYLWKIWYRFKNAIDNLNKDDMNSDVC